MTEAPVSGRTKSMVQPEKKTTRPLVLSGLRMRSGTRSRRGLAAMVGRLRSFARPEKNSGR